MSKTGGTGLHSQPHRKPGRAELDSGCNLTHRFISASFFWTQWTSVSTGPINTGHDSPLDHGLHQPSKLSAAPSSISSCSPCELVQLCIFSRAPGQRCSCYSNVTPLNRLSWDWNSEHCLEVQLASPSLETLLLEAWVYSLFYIYNGWSQLAKRRLSLGPTGRRFIILNGGITFAVVGP